MATILKFFEDHRRSLGTVVLLDDAESFDPEMVAEALQGTTVTFAVERVDVPVIKTDPELLRHVLEKYSSTYRRSPLRRVCNTCGGPVTDYGSKIVPRYWHTADKPKASQCCGGLYENETRMETCNE